MFRVSDSQNNSNGAVYVPVLHLHYTHSHACATYSIWVTVIPEVVVLSVCVVLSFVVGVTISIGLDVTCGSLQNATQTRYICGVSYF